jgi:hypothetical protein
MDVQRVAGLSGCLRILVPIILLIVLGIYSAFPHPTHNQSTLKAIAADSQRLIAAHPLGSTQRSAHIPKDQWPPAIASLNPEFVIVYDGAVNITTKPFFDGGWGYGFAPDKRNLGMLEECWSELGHDMFWHGPC